MPKADGHVCPIDRPFCAIVYMLRTGTQWNALPKAAGASSTVHDRFQEWERAGFFKALWQVGLSEYDELAGIVGTAAAIANAVHHATGIRICDLPLSPDKLLASLPH